jgi:hypothetical protein
MQKMEHADQLECLKQLVLEHQKTLSDGKIKLWGAVVKYVAHIESKLVFEFLPTGELLREIHEEVINAGASLTVGGRLIVGVES